MITGIEMIVILIIGVLMAACGLVIVTEPAWFWARLMGRRRAMAIYGEQANPEIRQSIFVLGDRVLGGIMLVADWRSLWSPPGFRFQPSMTDGSKAWGFDLSRLP